MLQRFESIQRHAPVSRACQRPAPHVGVTIHEPSDDDLWSFQRIVVRMNKSHNKLSAGTSFAKERREEATVMSLVRLLGFQTLACGCVIGRYRDLATEREVTYVEEKGAACELHTHRRNHTITDARDSATSALSARAS